MSSEATAYFPNAVASTPKLQGSSHFIPRASPELCRSEKPEIETASNPAEFTVSNSEISDEHLLKQVSDGDKDALALLFRRYARSVRNVAYRILRNEAEADDLVQEVFLFIFRKATLFNVGGAARSWIFRVTYHRGFDRRRYLNSRHFYASQEIVDAASWMADPREEIPFHERSMEGVLGKTLMKRFNRRLSLEQQETIQLYLFEGYGFKEIADLTGRPYAIVRSHYYRGLEQMRKYVLSENFGQSE
jgi:RNA polymerase sigma-70 factor (ECF subfamily)